MAALTPPEAKRGPQASAATPAPAGVLQRACACGQHSIAGGECEACRTDKEKVQAKLTVSRPGDVHEQEADRVAEAVMRMTDTDEPRGGPPLTARARSGPDHAVRRQADPERDQGEEKEKAGDEEEIRAKLPPGGQPTVAADHETRLDALQAGGEPMPAPARSFFEARLGQGLAGVRIHADPEAGRLAEAMHAHAFASGQHIFFAPGRYQPETHAGRRLLAHELTHTLQQRREAISSVADTIFRRAAPEAPSPAPPAAGPIPAAPPPVPAPTEAAGPVQAVTPEGPTTPAAPPPPGPAVPAAPPEPDAEGPGVPPAAGPGAPVPPTAPPPTEGDGGAALPEWVTLDTSGESGLLQSLATVPASSFGPAVTQANRAAGQLQAQARADLADSLPVIDRPTGLPRLSERPAPEATVVEAGRAPEPEPPGAREEPPPDTRHQEASDPLPATAVQTRVEEPASEDDGGDWWDWLSGAVGRFLRQLPTADPTLDTSAGERPRVDTTGDADPARNERQQRATDQEVAGRQAEADAATRGDFGEQGIYPDRPRETMRPGTAPGEPPAAAGAGVHEPGAVPAEVRAGLDQAGAGWLSGEVGQRVEQERQDHAAYERDSAQARADSQRQIDEETARVRGDQEEAQAGARRDVADQRDRWREENRRIREAYGEQAAARRAQVDGQIDAQVRDTEQRADGELSRAESQAEERRRDTERRAEEKKREAENQPRSVWDRMRGAVSDFFDALKEAVNALFDELRRVVRDLIERAKRVVREWIEAARNAIVGLIRGFGEFLKGVASLALAAFPGAAERARRWIDHLVGDAVEVVNRAADLLQAAVQRLLDALGTALDFVLSVYQRAYLLLIDGLRLLAVGLIEIMERIGHLIDAARQMPDHLFGQASEELLGQDLSQPLPFELTEPPTPAATVAAAVATGQIPPADARALTRTAVGDADVAVDQVAPLELDPGFLVSLNLREGEEREFGEASDPSRTVAAVQREHAAGVAEGAEPAAATTTAAPPEELPAPAPAAAPQPATPTPAEAGATTPAATTPAALTPEQRLEQMMNAPAPPCPKKASSDKAEQSTFPQEQKFGPLTIWQRTRYVLNQMVKGIKNWFSCNWPWLLAGAIGVLAVGIVTTILTGGAILAAIPPLMELIGMIMVGVTVGRVTLYVGEYLTKGWAGEIGPAARSLARGLAVGAIELISTLLFDLGSLIKAAKQGVTATLRGALATARRAGTELLQAGRQVGRAAIRTLRAPGRAAALVGRVALQRGRMIFQGLRRGFARGVRSIEEFARRLWNAIRFRRFKLVRRGFFLQLWGFINPWVLIAEGPMAGELREVSEEAVRGLRPGEVANLPALSGAKVIVEPLEPLVGGSARVAGRLSGDAGEVTRRAVLAAKHPAIEAELRAADALASQGVNTHFRTAAGDIGQPGRTADLLVGGAQGTGAGGNLFDVISPTTSNAGRVSGAIASKLQQADRFAVDLSRTTLTPADLSNLIQRVNGVPNISRPLQEVVFFRGRTVIGRLSR